MPLHEREDFQTFNLPLDTLEFVEHAQSMMMVQNTRALNSILQSMYHVNRQNSEMLRNICSRLDKLDAELLGIVHLLNKLEHKISTNSNPSSRHNGRTMVSNPRNHKRKAPKSVIQGTLSSEGSPSSTCNSGESRTKQRRIMITSSSLLSSISSEDERCAEVAPKFLPDDLAQSLRGVYGATIYERYYREHLYLIRVEDQHDQGRKILLEIEECIYILEHFLPENHILNIAAWTTENVWKREVVNLSEELQLRAVEYISKMKNSMPSRSRHRKILGTVTGITRAWRSLKAANMVHVQMPKITKILPR